MTREFVYTRTFFDNWKEAGLNDSDFVRLEDMLIRNPKLGEVIPGTGSARKMRFAYEGRGKRGSARVIYVDYEVGEKICFLAAYAKSSKENLTEEEKHILKITIEALGKYMITKQGDDKMSKLFDDMMSSLNEIIAYENGENADVVVHKVTIQEVKAFSPAEIKQIRLNADMTQSTFAACIGVTKKAVEAWEGGRSKPDGAARRTLGLLQMNPRFADETGIIMR